MVVKEFIEEISDKDERALASKVWNWTKGVAYGAVASAALWGSFYTVPQNSQAVVQRFGEYTRTTESGLHFKIPFIEDVTKVPVKQAQTEEFGFRALKPGVDSQYITIEDITSGKVSEKDLEHMLANSGVDMSRVNKGNLKGDAENLLRGEYLTLTGDLNMADVEFIVQYDIKDPVAYLFNVNNPRQTIRDCSLAVMKQLTGNGSVDEAINIGRIDYENDSKKLIQRLMDNYETGINVTLVKLQSSNPPTRVSPAFHRVVSSIQEKETKINQAKQAYNEVVPKAKGEAQQKIEIAKGYAVERVNKAKGEVLRFNEVYQIFKQDPEITKQRMYFETMSKVLPQVDEKWIIESGNDGLLRLLNLNQGARQDGKK
jgi:membrane protease subunit HflK